MVHNHLSSAEDALTLKSLLSRVTSKALGPIPKKVPTYKNKIVPKPWGHEYLIFETEHVAVWLLTIQPKHATSMHCHPQKKTSIVLLEGELNVELLSSSHRLEPFGALTFSQGVFHRLKALGSAPVRLLEVETPRDGKDLIRLEDRYGREEKPYEAAVSQTKQSLDTHPFYLEEPAPGETIQYDWEGWQIRVLSAHSVTDLIKMRPHSRGSTILCTGQIQSKEWTATPADVLTPLDTLLLDTCSILFPITLFEVLPPEFDVRA